MPVVRTWPAGPSSGVLAADLLAGDEDPRAGVVDLLHRSLAALAVATQVHGGHGRVRVRADIGYFTKELAEAILAADADCASCRYDTVEPSRFFRLVSRRYMPTPNRVVSSNVERRAHSRVPTRFRVPGTPPSR